MVYWTPYMTMANFRGSSDMCCPFRRLAASGIALLIGIGLLGSADGRYFIDHSLLQARHTSSRDLVGRGSLNHAGLLAETAWKNASE